MAVKHLAFFFFSNSSSWSGMYSPEGNKQMLPSVSAEIYVHKTHTLEVMLARPFFHGCKPLSPAEKPDREVA